MYIISCILIYRKWHRKSMLDRYNAAKLERANTMWNVQRVKARKKLDKLANIRLGDEKRDMSSYVFSFTELERKILFMIVKKVNELTQKEKLRYLHFAAMFKTYHENCRWTATSYGEVCISFRYYDAPCVPLCGSIKPKKTFDTFEISGHLLIMDRLCQFLSRPYAMALCMALFSKGGCCDTLFM